MQNTFIRRTQTGAASIYPQKEQCETIKSAERVNFSRARIACPSGNKDPIDRGGYFTILCNFCIPITPLFLYWSLGLALKTYPQVIFLNNILTFRK